MMSASEEGSNTGGCNNQDLSFLLYMLRECFHFSQAIQFPAKSLVAVV